jgi:hypothetical protein
MEGDLDDFVRKIDLSPYHYRRNKINVCDGWVLSFSCIFFCIFSLFFRIGKREGRESNGRKGNFSLTL